MMSDRLLVLVRHGESEWNLKNLFTGWMDVDLTEKGIAEARAAGRKLKAQGISFDVAFTSALIRAQRSLDLILEEMGQSKVPISGIRPPMNATMEICPASIRTMQGQNGVPSKCSFGDVRMTWHHLGVRASKIRLRGCCPIISRKFYPPFSGASGF